jgi:hypothetical protein
MRHPASQWRPRFSRHLSLCSSRAHPEGPQTAPGRCLVSCRAGVCRRFVSDLHPLSHLREADRVSVRSCRSLHGVPCTERAREPGTRAGNASLEREPGTRSHLKLGSVADFCIACISCVFCFVFLLIFVHFCFFLLAKNMNQTKPAARSADVHAGKAEGPRVHKRAANAEVRSAPRTVLLPQRVAARLTLATRPRGTYSGQARLRQRYRHGV